MVMIINHSKQFYSNELIPETLIAVINISQELFHNPWTNRRKFVRIERRTRCEQFFRKANFQKKFQSHPLASFFFHTPSSLDPLHSFSRIPDWKQRSVSRETREYDLRRDSLERIEKQRRRMTVQNRSREDRMKRRWRDGRARLNEEFGVLLQECRHQRIIESIYPWIDLIIVATPLGFDAWLTRPTCAHCPRTDTGNYVFATASRSSILSLRLSRSRINI